MSFDDEVNRIKNTQGVSGFRVWWSQRNKAYILLVVFVILMVVLAVGYTIRGPLS